jgi:C-terminal processing protease CtpA/Prc
VLGTRTAGNVAAGQVFPLGDGSALQITVMEILTGEGQPLNRVGLEPNEVVDAGDAPPTTGPDPVLARAIDVLRGAGTAVTSASAS